MVKFFGGSSKERFSAEEYEILPDFFRGPRSDCPSDEKGQNASEGGYGLFLKMTTQFRFSLLTCISVDRTRLNFGGSSLQFLSQGTLLWYFSAPLNLFTVSVQPVRRGIA
jgi:hypothetical protein